MRKYTYPVTLFRNGKRTRLCLEIKRLQAEGKDWAEAEAQAKQMMINKLNERKKLKAKQ